MKRWWLTPAAMLSLAIVVVAIFLVASFTRPPSIGTQEQRTYGVALYEQYCMNCHGPLASSHVRNSTSTQIQTAISTVPQMKGLSTLTPEQIQEIADALSP